MDFVYKLILILHFIGLASVVGGFLVQMRSSEKGVNPAMLHGALTQLVTGVILVGLAEMQDEDVDHAKIAVKLVITIVITVLAFVGRRKLPPQVGFWVRLAHCRSRTYSSPSSGSPVLRGACYGERATGNVLRNIDDLEGLGESPLG